MTCNLYGLNECRHFSSVPRPSISISSALTKELVGVVLLLFNVEFTNLTTTAKNVKISPLSSIRSL